MLKISEAQVQAFSDDTEDAFVKKLMSDLYDTYPERFALMEGSAIVDYVRQRLAFAKAHNILQENNIAAMCHCEVRSGSNYLRARDGERAHHVLNEDLPEDMKIDLLKAPLNHLEADPDFVPSEFD